MKEIIIDGVNVAECKYYHYKGCTANNFGKCDSSSEIYKNCYFKQLKRLEQENEKLKKQLEIDKNQINYFIEENEELKQKFEKIKDYIYDNTDFDKGDFIQSKTAGYDILQIIEEK